MDQARRTLALRRRKSPFARAAFLLGLTAMLGSVVPAVPAAAQSQPACAPRERMVRNLAAYGEIPVASGLMGNGALIEILTSPSGTWSIIATRPDGTSCLIVVGDGWQGLAPAVPGRDS